MKAQASLEYMFLALVTIAVLSVSIFALMKIKDNAEASQRLIYLKHDSELIFAANEEACVAGSGNSRTILLSGKERMHFVHMGHIMEFNYYGSGTNNAQLSLLKNATCEGYVDYWATDKITIENEKGIITAK